MTVLIISLVALVALLIFWTAFRNWIGRQLNAIWGLLTIYAPTVANAFVGVLNWLGRVLGIYSIILLGTSVVALVLMIIALLFLGPTASAFLFVLAICLVILAWLPAGVILRLFRITDAVVPCALRSLIAWVAFVGWLCLMAPDVITTKSLVAAALVGFIFLGATYKTKAIDKLIVPLVVIMCLWTAWSFFWTESFRSTTRYVESWAKRIQTHKDRGSIDNEVDAATTYGIVLQDITVLYTCPHDTILDEQAVDTVKIGTKVKIGSHKKEIRVIDGQGFIEIQLPDKKTGSFVRAKKYLVEAEYVQLASPREVTPEDRSLLRKRGVPNNEPTLPAYVGGIFSQGDHVLPLKKNQESDWCSIQDGCKYMFLNNNSIRITLTFEDGSPVNSWEITQWPNKYKFKVKNLTDDFPVLRVR